MASGKSAEDRETQYRSANVESARLILARVDAYGGENAALVRWARMVLGQDGADSGEMGQKGSTK